jgi:hypothetical protein
MRDLLQLQSLVHAYRDFAECVVKSIEWLHYGTSVAITFDYTWKPDGRLRADEEERLLVRLRFKLVQEFEICNGLTGAMLVDDSAINWGFNEVSRVVVQDDERSSKYSGFAVPMHHASLRRESGPWIDIVFGELEITESSAPSNEGE